MRGYWRALLPRNAGTPRSVAPGVSRLHAAGARPCTGCQAPVCTVAPGRAAGEPVDMAMLVEVEVRQGRHLAPGERQMHLVIDAPDGRERRHHVRPEVAVGAEHEQTRCTLTAIDQHIGHRGCATIAHTRFHAW